MTSLHSSLAMTWRLAVRNLGRRGRRSSMALSTVAFGIAALMVARGFTEAMFVDFREATIEAELGHIQISRPGFQEEGRSDPFRYLLPQEGETAAIGPVAHLRALAPRLMVTGLVARGEATLSFVGEGVDPAVDVGTAAGLRIIDGRSLSTASVAEVMLGRGLAAMLGAKVGDTVALLANTPRGGLNAVEARVVGIFASVSKAYDDSALVVPLAAARPLLKARGSHTWRLYLDDTAQTERTAALLRQRLDPKAFEVRTWDQLAEFYVRAVALMREQVDVLRVIVVAIILLGIGNTMMMAVMERTGEIGTAMALGVRPGTLLFQITAEGALLGLAGGALGGLLALLASAGLAVLQIPMAPPPGLTRGYVAGVLVTPSGAVEGMALALATTVLGSLYPAWRAGRMAIVDAIRHNR